MIITTFGPYLAARREKKEENNKKQAFICMFFALIQHFLVQLSIVANFLGNQGFSLSNSHLWLCFDCISLE